MGVADGDWFAGFQVQPDHLATTALRTKLSLASGFSGDRS